jgi:hypothetical protein
LELYQTHAVSRRVLEQNEGSGRDRNFRRNDLAARIRDLLHSGIEIGHADIEDFLRRVLAQRAGRLRRLARIPAVDLPAEIVDVEILKLRGIGLSHACQIIHIKLCIILFLQKDVSDNSPQT